MGLVWYMSKTWKISSKLRLGVAIASSLHMRMILKIQQKIPKLSEEVIVMTLMEIWLDLVEKVCL